MPYEYFSDEEHIIQWLEKEKDPEDFKNFLQTYIYETKDYAEYIERCGGIKRIIELRAQEHLIDVTQRSESHD
jgi:glutaconate CoA-transferase subunit A